VTLAQSNGFRRVFENDPDIGGRYSVLSYFGLVPAACMGVAIEALLHRCQVAEQNCTSYDQGTSNSGLWLGIVMGALANAGRDKLTFIVSEPISSFGLWVEQLVAESTGKQGKGVLPVADEPIGPPDAYGDDRLFAYLRNADDPDEELDAKMDALAKAGQPVLTLSVHGATDLGRIFFFAEFAVAVGGWAIGINPFDQPNVQEAKDNTDKVLDGFRTEGHLPEVTDADHDALRALLSDAGPPHYVAVLGYLEPSARFDRAVVKLREALRAKTGAAVTFGYGPRFQHSTGQMHKGGPPVGRFLQLVHDQGDDVDIPGEEYSFRTLKHAAATGDLQTLRDHGLPAERVTLEGDPVDALHELTQKIERL
jgi:glucose-6-phosphate isomerase/transaldolase/glucose-6-phosphate isomerase